MGDSRSCDNVGVACGGTSRSCDNVGVVHGKEIRMDWYSSTWHCLRWSGGCNVWVWHVPISHAKKVGSY